MQGLWFVEYRTVDVEMHNARRPSSNWLPSLLCFDSQFHRIPLKCTQTTNHVDCQHPTGFLHFFLVHLFSAPWLRGKLWHRAAHDAKRCSLRFVTSTTILGIDQSLKPLCITTDHCSGVAVPLQSLAPVMGAYIVIPEVLAPVYLQWICCFTLVIRS